MIKLTKRKLNGEVRYCLSRGEYEIHLSLYPHMTRSQFARDLIAARDMIRGGFRFA